MVPLSALIQSKKDQQGVFQSFDGTPEELMAFVKDSQKGVDAMKAMREIRHAAERVVVNDGYVWIRKILKNSIDAVGENESTFTEVPNVKVESYLRQGSNDLVRGRAEDG